jgi:hypothetical protein
MPGHELTRFYALLPLLATLAAMDPATAEAILTASGILAALHQLR